MYVCVRRSLADAAAANGVRQGAITLGGPLWTTAPLPGGTHVVEH